MTISPTTRYLGNGSAILEWQVTNEPNVHGWKVARDGVDTKGTGAWQSPILPPETRSYTFNLLQPGSNYNLSLIAVYASYSIKVAITDGVPEIPVPPVTTPTNPTTPTTPTTPDGGGTGITAALRYKWGTPVWEDDFNGTKIDTSKWGLPGEPWPANSTVKAGRWASHNSVQDGYLRQTGTPDGKTGYVSSKYGQKYGRWEVRCRVITVQPGKAFHPVLITWPDSDKWPEGAEYDFLEINSDAKNAEAYLHFPNHKPRVQEYAKGPAVDWSQWHNVGFEWSPSGLKGYLDGIEWFSFNKDGIQNAPGPMHLTCQLDNFVGSSGMAKVYFDIDWARAYRLT